ncbi:MAG: carbohydrate-binding protein [Ruminococcus sp.]|nr:carbohydrate-binding protein [Ruminococcus sp.]
MTKTSKRSRLTAIVLTLAMALGIFGTMGVASASAATDKISLYSSGATFQKYGRTSYEIFIKTRGNVSSQNVYVHYNYLDGENWKDAKATYVTKLDDGSNIWKATLGSYNLQYALKLVSNGQETWDNNNGKNYTADDIIGSAAPVASERLGYQYDKYQINAVLQNYTYNKTVFVRYTTDGWKTSNDQPLTYSKTNANGTETWTTKLNLSSSATSSNNFQYAICYRISGTEFWANNFGANYDSTYRIYH